MYALKNGDKVTVSFIEEPGYIDGGIGSAYIVYWETEPYNTTTRRYMESCVLEVYCDFVRPYDPSTEIDDDEGIMQDEY